MKEGKDGDDVIVMSTMVIFVTILIVNIIIITFRPKGTLFELQPTLMVDNT